MSNSSVVELLKVGLGDEAVIAKIKGSDASYDTSTGALIALKGQGVSSAVIAAMIEAANRKAVAASEALSVDSPDPAVPHASGVYMLANWLSQPRMIGIDATTSNQTKTGGFLGYALTGGLASMSFKAVVPGNSAKAVTGSPRPTFYFYFDQANRGGSSAVFNAGAVTSPQEFSLVKFTVKDDRREAKVGKFNIGGAKAGVMDKDRIPFSATQLRPGVYEIRPDAALLAGQYGFMVQVTTGGGAGMSGMGAMSSKIFDFAIAPAAGSSAAK
ncbi:hypothetical protein [Novosphingobium sp.]|uniref:hypothetical protein n=1 Tax=Novosphingobium sp. TaxID=1874826 RepID=UPI0025E48F9A|nr:hypothetical protein [Novosphingobium sp.]